MGADVACRDLQIEAQTALLAVIVPQQTALRIPIDLGLNFGRTTEVLRARVRVCIYKNTGASGARVTKSQ